MRNVVFAIAIVLFAAAAQAQTPVTVNASSGVAFTPSSEHNTVVGGVPAVTNYELEVITQNAAGALAFTLNLGKPTPDASNTITVQPISQFGSLSTGVYTATVTAIGPGGSGVSTPTDPFVRIAAPSAPGKPVVKS